jgi:hypothetical protein
MQTPLQREGVRRRLGDLIRQRFGDLNPAALSLLSAKARVHYTSLARYLLYPQQRRTRALRRHTLDAVSIALDANPTWVRDGQGQKQLSLWPILLPTSAEGAVTNPDDQVSMVLELVRTLPQSIRFRAYRAAVAAVIEVVTSEGGSPGDEAYRCLMRLDALRRSPAARAVG